MALKVYWVYLYAKYIITQNIRYNNKNNNINNNDNNTYNYYYYIV